MRAFAIFLIQFIGILVAACLWGLGVTLIIGVAASLPSILFLSLMGIILAIAFNRALKLYL